jgi:hypothetical protein
MANLIQIKRSLTTADAPALANGELAFTANGDHLFIGSNGEVFTIAGKFNPGVLTANQALVANGTSFIDQIKVANATITKIFANGAFGTAGQILTSNSTGGVFFAAPAAAATDLDGLTDVAVASASAGQVLVANSAGTFRNVSLSGDITVDSAGVVSIAADSVALGTDTTGNYVATITAGNGISGSSSTEGGAATIAVVANNGLASNSSGVFVIAGTNGGLVSNTTGVFITPGSGLVANATGLHVGTGNGVSITADAIDVVAGTNGGLVSNATGVFVVTGDGLLSNSSGLHVGSANGITIAADTVGVLTGSTLSVNASGVHVNSALSITDLSLSGNLNVLGTLTTIDTTNLTVKDSLIELANGNSTTDILDIGLYGQFGSSGSKYTGFFRDATDGIYKLFTGSQTEPTTTVDTAAAGYTTATLQAFLSSGGLTTNATHVAITANSTVNVSITANTLTLSTPLGVASGGLGLSTITTGAILVGNGTGPATLLAAATDGFVLQSNGTSVVYGTLDGGTF